MPRICISKSDQHWFRWWLGAYSVPSHYLKQCSAIVNRTLRNKLQWNFNQNIKFYIHENASENIVSQMAAILSRGKWVKIHWRHFYNITLSLNNKQFYIYMNKFFYSTCIIRRQISLTFTYRSPEEPTGHCFLIRQFQYMIHVFTIAMALQILFGKGTHSSQVDQPFFCYLEYTPSVT